MVDFFFCNVVMSGLSFEVLEKINLFILSNVFCVMKFLFLIDVKIVSLKLFICFWLGI